MDKTVKRNYSCECRCFSLYSMTTCLMNTQHSLSYTCNLDAKIKSKRFYYYFFDLHSYPCSGRAHMIFILADSV